MKNRFIAAAVAGLMISATCSTGFAGIESAVCDGNNIVITGTASTNEAGERFSLMLHNLYNAENPAESVVIADQGVSGQNGAFTYTLPLSDMIGDGSYTLRYGDSSGAAEEIDLSIDRVEDVSISMSEAGHIFFEPSKIEVNVTLSNGNTMQRNDIRARVYTEDENELVFDEVVTTLEMKAQERFSGKLTIDLTNAEKRYGMFVLKLAMVPAGTEVTEEDFKAEIRFSVAKKSDELNSKIGIHTQFGHGWADPAVNTKLLKNAGYHGIRDYVAYSQCFSGGVWSEPERYNKWVDDVNANSLTQIIQLDSTNEGFPKTEAEIQNFTNYAVAIVSNLAEDGVYWYELCNEMNWNCTAEEYANLLISVAPAIKAVNKEKVKLLAFAAAGVDNFHSVNWIVDIIKILQERGLDPHDYIDYISVHPYKPLNQAPEKKTRTCTCTFGTESFEKGESENDTNDTIPGDSSLTARMDNLTNRLKEVECDDIPFIATEIGWYSYVGESGQTDCEICIERGITSLDEIGQAQYSVRAAALLYNKIAKIYFHTFNNKYARYKEWEENFGFMMHWSEAEIPYEAKPVFIAMANFNAMLGNAELTEENADGTKYDYVFQKDGKTTHMMWTTSNSASKTINVPGKAICIYDMYGNLADKQYSSDGSYNIALSGSPVYVEETAVIPELEIVDASGTAVGSIGNNTQLCASMSTLSATKEKGMLICVAYRDDVLVEAKAVPVNTGTMSAQTPHLDVQNADMVKAFYWKKANNIPYCEAVTIIK